MADINPVLAAAAKNNAELASARTSVSADTSASNAAYKIIGDTARSVGVNNAVIESAKQTGDLQTQAARDAVAASLGTDVSQTSNKLLELNNSLLESMGIRKQALAAVNEKQRVGLFDDPLQWVMNQLTVNDDIAKFNAANAEVTNKSDTIAALNSATQQSILTQNALKHTTSEAAALASIQNTRNIAEIQARQTEVLAYHNNIQGTQAVLAMSNQQLANNNIVFHAKESAEQLALSYKGDARAERQLQLSEERQAAEKELWASAIEKKNMEKLSQDEQLRILNIGRVNRGAPPLTGSAITRFLTMRAKDGNIHEEFQEDYKRGAATLVKGDKVISLDAAGFIDTLNTVGIALTPAQAPLRAVVETVTQKVAEEIARAQHNGTGPLAGGKLTKEVVDARQNEVMKEVLNGYRNKIVPGDADNPYNIGAVSDLIQLPNVATLPVVVKVLAPLLASQGGAAALNDPAKLASMVLAAAEKGDISWNELMSVPLIFQRGNALNNAAKQFKSLGLPENQNYPVKLPIGVTNRFSTPTVDMANEADWKRFVGKYLAGTLPAIGLPIAGQLQSRPLMPAERP